MENKNLLKLLGVDQPSGTSSAGSNASFSLEASRKTWSANNGDGSSQRGSSSRQQTTMRDLETSRRPLTFAAEHAFALKEMPAYNTEESILMMAVPRNIILGYRAYNNLTYGVRDCHTLKMEMLRHPFLMMQLIAVLDLLLAADYTADEIVLWPNGDMTKGHQKTAMKVEADGVVSLYTLWYPARDEAWQRKLASGQRAWTSNSTQEEWKIMKGSKISFAAGVGAYVNFIFDLCELLPLILAGNQAVAPLSGQIYSRLRESIGNDLSTEAKRKAARSVIKGCVRAFTSDATPLVLIPGKPYPAVQSPLDAYIIQAVAGNSLPDSHARLAKDNIKSGCSLYRTLFDLELALSLREQPIKEARARETAVLLNASANNTAHEENDSDPDLPPNDAKLFDSDDDDFLAGAADLICGEVISDDEEGDEGEGGVGGGHEDAGRQKNSRKTKKGSSANSGKGGAIKKSKY